MSPKIRELLQRLKAAWSGLPRAARVGIGIALATLVFVFLGTYGVKERPISPGSQEFKPYRPERRVVADDKVKQEKGSLERNFPRPPGPGVEASLLEEIKSLKGEIDKLRSSVMERLDSERNEAGEKVMTAVSQLRQELRSVSLELTAIKEKFKKDEQALKEQSPIELLGIVSAGGLRYAILRTEAGDKRLTEGDKVGPWMIEEIGTKEVRLSAPGQKRILALR